MVQGVCNGNHERLRRSTTYSIGAGSKTYGLMRVLGLKDKQLISFFNFPLEKLKLLYSRDKIRSYIFKLCVE